MARKTFSDMRDDLIKRGLITSNFRLTDAGMDYTDRLLETLPKHGAPSNPSAPRVRWVINRNKRDTLRLA